MPRPGQGSARSLQRELEVEDGGRKDVETKGGV
jgi:hypothetical protein